MGKQTRVIAYNAKDKQTQQTKKPKAVKTNLKRVRRLRNKYLFELFMEFYLVK
jgi:hypothetical protein